MFTYLVISLLVLSSNLGLINNIVSIQASDGGNLVGLRDVVILVVLLVGSLRLLRQSRTASGNRLAQISLIVVLLTPVAALVGLLYGGGVMDVARESVTMLGWLLAFILGTNLRNRQSLQSIVNSMVIIGLLVAIGVFVEAISIGEIRLVTPADVVTSTGRSTPSGWPIMMLGASIALVSFLSDGKSSGPSRWFYFITWVLILVASFLTLSRTLIAGLAVSSVMFLILVLFSNRRFVRWSRVLLVLALIPTILTITFLFGERIIRNDFTEFFVSRYLVLESVNAAIEYSQEDTRRAELELGLQRFVESPVLGVGLGSQYREASLGYYGEEDPAILVHNILGFFLFRYGPLGLLLFLLLILRVLGSLRLALRDTGELATTGVGLSVAMVNLFAGGLFGNVFAMSYGAPIAMAALGCLIAYEEMRVGNLKRGFRKIVFTWTKPRSSPLVRIQGCPLIAERGSK